MGKRIESASEILSGDIVETRGGERYLAVEFANNRDLFLIGNTGFMKLSSFDSNFKLTVKGIHDSPQPRLDIVKVFRGFTAYGLGVHKTLAREDFSEWGSVETVYDEKRDRKPVTITIKFDNRDTNYQTSQEALELIERILRDQVERYDEADEEEDY